MVFAVVALLILILGAILFPGFVKGLLYSVLVIVPGAFILVWLAGAFPQYVILFSVATMTIVIMCVIKIIPWS